MCYSALIKANLKKLSEEFRSAVDKDAFIELYLAREGDPELKIPFGLDRFFALSADPTDQKLGQLARKFLAAELARTEASLKETEQELRELETGKQTKANLKKHEVRVRRREKLQKKLGLSFERISPLDERIYPGTFAPVILSRGGSRTLVPMRYRVRRPDGFEIPSQYNVFNARRDSLQNAPTWKPLFGHTHAIFPFVKFFEWVERDGGKKEISFSPENRSMMWAASLYSAPSAKVSSRFLSFAMVTDEPPPEVAAAGHDRCPVFLSESHLEEWLNPRKKSLEFLNSLLDHKEKAFYLHHLVA